MNYGEKHAFHSLFEVSDPLLIGTITAGAGADGNEQNGVAFDRLAAGRQLHLSGSLIILWEAALAEGETLTLAANMQDDSASAFNVAPADYGTAIASGVVATGPAGGGTMRGQSIIPLNLQGARQYVRPQVTQNLSRANTDTVKYAVLLVLGGGEKVPVTQL